MKFAFIRRFLQTSAQTLTMTFQAQRTRKIMGILFAAGLAILSISTFLDIRSSQNLQKVAKEQFNEEQLVIARNIKHNIERELAFLNKEIEMITQVRVANRADVLALGPVLQHTLSRVMKNGIFHISIKDPIHSQVYSFEYSRQWNIALPEAVEAPETPDFYNSDSQRLFVSFPMQKTGGICLMMGRAFHQSDFILTMELDITRFLGQFLRQTRSGKTGYAWVVSEDGTFLDHPFTEFIGKNAFTARDLRNPEVSHETINFIQENRMLKGQEGTGAYTTGWHRGITGRLEKLIAYCPVYISDHPPQQWSVAVVAPASEINDYIRKAYAWRWLFQIILIFVIIFGGGAFLLNEMRWTRMLENRVADRTLALKKSEEKYRSLVESAEDFIYTVNQEGEFLSINSFTANFLGGRPEDFTGRRIDLVFSDEAFDNNLKILGLVFRHGRSIREVFTLKVGDHKLWLSVNFMPIREESGKVGSVLCIARDVTSEKNMEHQLINAEKLASMGTLAAGVAHEINNPLGVILGFTDLLVRKTLKGTQAYDDLKTIERQGNHCKQIVENLLRFARFGDGKAEKADLNVEIREIVAIVAHTLEMENIGLETALADNIPMICGDPRELQQVFLNLINNAASAMKGGGRLSIRSRFDQKSQKAEIRIEDTGHGILQEHMDRIFEPFFTTKPEGEGTGLGLAVTYGIISKNGGTIECESVAADTPKGTRKRQGTVFSIKLPVFPQGQPT